MDPASSRHNSPPSTLIKREIPATEVEILDLCYLTREIIDLTEQRPDATSLYKSHSFGIPHDRLEYPAPLKASLKGVQFDFLDIVETTNSLFTPQIDIIGTDVMYPDRTITLSILANEKEVPVVDKHDTFARIQRRSLPEKVPKSELIIWLAAQALHDTETAYKGYRNEGETILPPALEILRGRAKERATSRHSSVQLPNGQAIRATNLNQYLIGNDSSYPNKRLYRIDIEDGIELPLDSNPFPWLLERVVIEFIPEDGVIASLDKPDGATTIRVEVESSRTADLKALGKVLEQRALHYEETLIDHLKKTKKELTRPISL